MRQKTSAIILAIILFTQIIAVSALSTGDAKNEWLNLKQISKEKRELYRDAKTDFAAYNSEVNKQDIINTGKETLHAALNEAEAWLIWKELVAKENSQIPANLKSAIESDVETNLGKINGLRSEVDSITDRLDLGIVFLKMIGKYSELITDVARNNGLVLVYRANLRIESLESFEGKLRAVAKDTDSNEELDLALLSIQEAKSNIEKSKNAYNKVIIGGTPLIKHAEANSYLGVARVNMLEAHSHLTVAYKQIRGAKQ